MLFAEKLSQPGEHAFVFQGKAGQLEGILTVPASLRSPYVALLGHPHSLQGGSMTNKVVTTMARAFRELGIPGLRFNFRGVGHSEGQYDDGIGESDDLLLLRQLYADEYPDSHFLLAGFSFGSFVTYRAAGQCVHDLLISVAPPVHHYDYHLFQPAPPVWHILQGETDEVVPPGLVFDFAKQANPAIPVSPFADTGHFFHGKLLELKAELMRVVQDKVLSK